MATKRGGPLWIKLSRDEKGQRTYTVPFQVETDTTPGLAEGPQAVLTAAGMPVPGSLYFIGSDFDPWAYCTRKVEVEPDPSIPMTPGGPVKFYIATYEFKSPGSADPGELPNCTGDIENPLFQPMVIRRSYSDYTEEMTRGISGPFRNSSHEPIRGPLAEFENTRMIVTIEQNLLDPEDDLLDELNNTVNQDVLWGKPRRSVRFVVKDVQRLFYGTCFRYYKRILEFRVRTRTDPVTGVLSGDWDRDVDDLGYRALNGRWLATAVAGRRWQTYPVPGYTGTPNPNPSNPSHFVQIPGPDGLQLSAPMMLNGAGLPYEQDSISNVITGCTRCANGAPFTFVVQGLGDEHNITYQGSSCQWQGGSTTLSYDDPNTRWLLTNSNYPGLEWTVPLTSFRCMAATSLVVEPRDGLPDRVTIRPFIDSQEGRHRLEYYRGSDLLRLHIPTSLS